MTETNVGIRPGMRITAMLDGIRRDFKVELVSVESGDARVAMPYGWQHPRRALFSLAELNNVNLANPPYKPSQE